MARTFWVCPTLILLLSPAFAFQNSGSSPDIVEQGIAPTACTPITYGQSIDGDIGLPGEQDCFTFDGEAGQRVTVFLDNRGERFALRLAKPNETSPAWECGPTIWDCEIDNITLPTTGIYTITADGSGDGTGDYTLTLVCLTPPCGIAQTDSLICDLPVTDTIDDPVDTDLFSFSVSAGEIVSFTVTVGLPSGPNFSTYWRLIDGQGNAAPDCGSFTLASQKDCGPLPIVGNPYRIEVTDFFNDDTGTYHLRLQRLTSMSACESIPLACGGSRTDVIDSPVDTDLLSFSVPDSEIVSIIVTEATPSGPYFSPYWRLIDGQGNPAPDCGSFTLASQKDCGPLPIVGNPYRIEVTDFFNDDTGTYQIGIGFLTSGCPSGINLTYNQIDPSNFPIVDSYVTVTDDEGNFISVLDSTNFTVQEEGQIESPISVTFLGTERTPNAVVLVMDRSGSMGGQPLEDAKGAAIDFVNELSASDQAAVITFNDTVTVDQPFTSDKDLLTTAVNALSAGGATAVYDALLEAVDLVNTRTGRKAILLLTDGEDNSSSSSLQDAINTAKQSNVPVFTLGLGLIPGSSAEQDLQQIADSTGGRYFFAPSSSDLQEIYQVISQQLQNQYKISYTTHNPNRDATSRAVQITVTYLGDSDSKTKTYVAPSAQPPIFPVASSPQLVGNEFWVDIKVGNSSTPVRNLFGLGFVLNFGQTEFIDVVSPHSSSVISGRFMGSDLVFVQTVDEAAGKVSVGMSRKAGQAEANGSGTVLQVRFVAQSNTPDNTAISFSITDVTANDSSGNVIQLSPEPLTIVIRTGVEVWPGDTNNDGVVNQVDVLPLGLHWSRTGPARPNASMSWTAQFSEPWSPLAATYADATGDGRVNQTDVLPIGLNWGKSHSIIFARASGQKLEKIRSIQTPTIEPDVTSSEQFPDKEFIVRIRVSEVEDLFGLAFELVYDPSELLEILSVEPDTSFGRDLIYHSNVDTTSGKVAVGISRKAGQGGVNGDISVVEIKSRISVDASSGATIHLFFQNVVANDSNGNPIDLSARSSSINVVTAVAADRKAPIPTRFRLYQNHPNPFNAGTLIEYEIPSAGHVRLQVYNLMGRKLRTLLNESQQPGRYRIRWDGLDERGHSAPSGVYIYRLRVGTFVESRRMLLVR